MNYKYNRYNRLLKGRITSKEESRIIRIQQLVQQGSLLKLLYLDFIVAENQTSVGTINDEGAIFTITSGQTIFDISELGVITFKVAPDYETQSIYSLVVKSSKNKLYRISVYVTDTVSLFALNTGTVLNLITAV